MPQARRRKVCLAMKETKGKRNRQQKLESKICWKSMIETCLADGRVGKKWNMKLGHEGLKLKRVCVYLHRWSSIYLKMIYWWWCFSFEIHSVFQLVIVMSHPLSTDNKFKEQVTAQFLAQTWAAFAKMRRIFLGPIVKKGLLPKANLVQFQIWTQPVHLLESFTLGTHTVYFRSLAFSRPQTQHWIVPNLSSAWLLRREGPWVPMCHVVFLLSVGKMLDSGQEVPMVSNTELRYRRIVIVEVSVVLPENRTSIASVQCASLTMLLRRGLATSQEACGGGWGRRDAGGRILFKAAESIGPKLLAMAKRDCCDQVKKKKKMEEVPQRHGLVYLSYPEAAFIMALPRNGLPLPGHH